MLGANFSSVGWPACGEIDIMELVGGDGNDNTCYATLHWDNDGEHAEYGESYTLPSGIFADDYHVFAVEWNSQEIKGFMDDIQYFVIDITPAQLSEFHNNFFIILNVAVGGDWPGSPDATTIFPQTMEVDWVRVYELAD
jgi:beta-glucanase (GH16 family)